MLVRWFFPLGIALFSSSGCGPNPKPDQPCDGPTFNLTLRARNGALPADTRLNVRYGGNNDGEPYELGETPKPEVVFCSENGLDEVDAEGSAGAPGAGGARAEAGESGRGAGGEGVETLSCRLYTQGPARIDVTARGYEPIVEYDLTLGKKRCLVDVEIELEPLMDAGKEQ